MPKPQTAIEFFSGIGAFADSTQELPIEIIAAFDQKAECNAVYKYNFKLAPCANNLDSVKVQNIPEAEIWWMSPPCTPYSRRGHRRDAEDPRAASFLHLLKLMRILKPRIVFVENVEGFSGSQVHSLMAGTFETLGMNLKEFNLCPTMFGIPMRRPRYFAIASHDNISDLPIEDHPRLPLADFLSTCDDEHPNSESPTESLSSSGGLIVPRDITSKYQAVLNVVDPTDDNATLICFTSGYYRCHKASGSLLKTSDDRIRRVSPREMLRLFGFSSQFRFPSELTLPQQWKLLGNSVETRCVKHLLSCAGISAATSNALQR